MVLHNQLGKLGQWIWVTEDLFDAKGNKRWFEHPALAGKVDLVALPLAHEESVQFYPLDVELRNEDVAVSPGDSVSIVGFPLGLAQSGGLPIWKTGTIASDLLVVVQFEYCTTTDLFTNWTDQPMFLIDTTSRQGMSGSPVYAVRSSTYRSKSGALMQPKSSTGTVKRLLGVYSEQIQEAELGGVWKVEALMDLYDSLP
jgi:hypothetical protein